MKNKNDFKIRNYDEYMKKIYNDEALTIIASLLLLFTAIIIWSEYSLLIFFAVILILLAWYIKKQGNQHTEKK